MIGCIYRCRIQGCGPRRANYTRHGMRSPSQFIGMEIEAGRGEITCPQIMEWVMNSNKSLFNFKVCILLPTSGFVPWAILDVARRGKNYRELPSGSCSGILVRAITNRRVSAQSLVTLEPLWEPAKDTLLLNVLSAQCIHWGCGEMKPVTTVSCPLISYREGSLQRG